MKYIQRFLEEFKLTARSAGSMTPIPVPVIMIIPTVIGVMILSQGTTPSLLSLLVTGIILYAIIFFVAALTVTILDLL
jgi:hypothetical protein